jgi:hypothetical protein
MSGHAPKHRHRGKGGRREDLGGRFFRSSWEANWARYLNWLVSLGEIASWDYECETFEFHKIKRGSRFYTPDFKLTLNDGRIEFHEVKGYMDERSATMLRRMAKYYPKVTLKVIAGKDYSAMVKKIGALLPGLE